VIGTVHALTIGHSQRIAHAYRTDLFLGAQVTGMITDSALRTFYGSTPVSGSVYLRLTPGRMRGM
jgi:hypothetical protein